MSETSVIQHFREEYKKGELLENTLAKEPMEQFGIWFKEAMGADLKEPTGMILSTVGAGNRPSSRVVLMRGFDIQGVYFFTNYQSRKGKELITNPNASIVFWWDKLERQVRLEGMVMKVSADESDIYFSQRPRGSQLGAWASAQSTVIDGRSELEKRYDEYEQQFENKEVTRPANWGGFKLWIERVEFWQGRESRLHDRLLYEKQTNGIWKMSRLSP